MIQPKDLVFCYRSGADAMARLAGDVADADFAAQPIESINHPAWLFQHVGIYHGVIVALLKQEDFPNPWAEPCGKDHPPVGDRSAYPAKDAILATHAASVDAAAEAMLAAPADVWSQPFEHATWGKQFESVGAAVVYLATTHLATHLGQLSGWRRAMNLPRV
ncbi:MAG: DinB family protein [Planctomycetota bacterium]